MSATFLHPRTNAPPDEMVDHHQPLCETCGSPMWLTKVETKVSALGIQARRSFECKTCRAIQWQEEQRTDPLPMASGSEPTAQAHGAKPFARAALTNFAVDRVAG